MPHPTVTGLQYRGVAACVVLSAAVQSLGVTVRLAESREAALMNPQVGFGAAHDFEHDGTMPYWPDWPTTPLWARETESIEVVRMGWNSVCTGPKTVNTARLERTLANVAARGKQAVLRVFGYDWDDANSTRWRALPDHFYAPSFPLTLCKDSSREGLLFVPDWDVEAILSEVESTAAALGRAFNGDKRLFAVEVGFVGFDASWQHGHSRIDACPLPSDASAQRIIKAMAEAFKDSFVLMPQPWAVPLFPYDAYPHMGIVDVNCGTTDMADNIGAVPALVDRWQTAPVFGVMRHWIERCWFAADNATRECARFGTGLRVPDYVDAVSQGHASMVQHGALFKWVSRDPADNHRAREAYLRTGALVHLAQVTLTVRDAQLHVCALLANLGTAPFHTPPSMPIALNLVVGTDLYELRSQSGGSIGTLLPNTTAAFASATVPWGEVDECTGDGAVCASHGQTCRDLDKTASSRGDWECVCAAGYAERGRVAVCKEVTLRRDEQRSYYKGKHDPIGEAVDHGMVGASFTVSTKVYVHACDTGGCGNDYVANEWDQMAIIGMWEWPSGDRDWRGLSLKYAARGILANFLYHTCHWKDTPLFPRNAWAHMGIVYNKAARTLQIYQNGAQMMVCNNWEPLKNTKLVIGKEFIPADPTNTVGQRHFKGWLKELRIMRGAATPQEMALLSQDAAEHVPNAVVRLRLDTEFTVRPVVRFASADDGSGHATVSAVDGTISFSVPPEDASATPEPCFVTPPTPSPPRDLMDCALARLEMHGHDTDSGTEPGGTAHAQCNGLYRHVVRPRVSTPSPPPPPPTPAPVPTPEFCRDYAELSDAAGTTAYPSSNGTEYTNGERVCLRIRCAGRTALRWTWFDLEDGYDYVTVSTVQESGALRYKWEQTGLLENPPSDTFDGDVFIFFESDASGTKTGFSFNYECVTPTPAPPAPTPAPPPLVEYWVKTAELDGTPLHKRELWPRDDGGLSCAFAAEAEDGRLLVGDVYTPEWWSEFFICESRTDAPTTVSPPHATVANHTWSPTAVPPPTAIPDTAAPPTAQPATPVPGPVWPVYTVDPNGTDSPAVIAYTGSPYTLPPPTPTVSHTLTSVVAPPPTETEVASATQSAEHADAATATATEAVVATGTATASAVLDTPIPDTLAPGPVVYSQPQGGVCPGPLAFKDGVCGSTECVCSYFASKPAPAEAASHPCEGAATCRSGLQQWQIESLLAQHNFYRAHHGACPVAYSKDVEEYTLGSDGFNTMCTSGVLTHNAWAGYGENYGEALDEGAAHTYDPASSVRQWYCEEEGCYDYSAAVFGLNSRRFTQLVWGATTEVGCALCHLPTAGAGSSGNVFIMCNYKEPGNWAGEFTQNVQPPSTTPSGCPTTVPDTAAPDTAAPNATVLATGVPLTDVPLTDLPSATDAPTPAPGTSDNTTAPAAPAVSQAPDTASPGAATGLPGTPQPTSGSPVAGATASPSVPSPAPSAVPSSVPSGVPSDAPVPSAVPSAVPAQVSSDMPSAAPSAVPSGTPAAVPSAAPSGATSTAPSAVVSSAPSGTATGVPAMSPTTGSPAVPPTTAPQPTGVPSSPVTAKPSATPVPDTATATPPQAPASNVPGVASTHTPDAPTAAPAAALTGAPAASTDTPPGTPTTAPGAAVTDAPTSPTDTDAPATAIQTHPPATGAPDTEAPAPAVKSIEVDDSFTITYSVVEGPTLEVQFVCEYGTWCGIAFGDTKSGADAVVCRGAVCTDAFARGYSAPTDDADQNVEFVDTQVVGARLHYVWRRRLDTGDPLDKVLQPGHEMITWLHGPLDSRGVARGIGVLELEAPAAPVPTTGGNSTAVPESSEPASSSAAPETAVPAAAANQSSASPGPGSDVDPTSPEPTANDTDVPTPLPPTEAPPGATDAATATLPASSPEGAKPTATATAVLDGALTPVPFRWVLDAPTDVPANGSSVSAAARPHEAGGGFGSTEVMLCIVAVFLCCGDLFIWAIVWRRRRESRRHWAVNDRTVKDSEMQELVKDKKDADPTLLPHDGLAPSTSATLSQAKDPLCVDYCTTGATTPPHGTPHRRSVLQDVSASSARKDSLFTQGTDDSGLIPWRDLGDDVSEDRQLSEGQPFPSRQPSCTFSLDEIVALPAGAFPRRNSRRSSFARPLGLRSDASSPLTGLKAQHSATPVRLATASSSLVPTRSDLCGSSANGSPGAGTARRRASLSISHIGLAPPRRRSVGSPCLSSVPERDTLASVPLAEDTSGEEEEEEGEEFLDSTQPANPLIQRAIAGPSPPKREVNLEPVCVLDVSDVGSVCTPFLDADDESQQNDLHDTRGGDPFLLGKCATEPADN